MAAGAGGRTPGPGYGADGVRQRFTGYERDAETGLDYAQARYYAAAQGRFTSVDPILMSKDRVLNPQEINLYAYCRNNPLIYTDPDGKYFVGKNGRRVSVAVREGKIIVGSNASADLKRMARLTNATGSGTAVSEFLKAGRHRTRINFKISPESSTYTDPADKKTYPLFGYAQPHDKNGKPLAWDSKQNSFEGAPVYVQDGKGNTAYKEVTITIYEGNIKGNVQGQYQEILSQPDRKLTVEEAMVISMSHEETHVTDQEGVDAVRNKRENFNPEATPFEVHQRVHKEIENNRKEEP